MTVKKFLQKNQCRLEIMQIVQLQIRLDCMKSPMFAQFLYKENNNLMWFKLKLANNKEMTLFLGPADQPRYQARQ